MIRFLLTILCLAAVASPPAPRSRALADEPDFLENFQGYLDPAPLGMDARYAWTLAGGRGENVRVCDIEYNWNLTHNDIAAAASNLFLYVKGVNPLPDQAINDASWNHGTAVIGEMIAADDGKGVTGIANRARLGLVNPLTGGSTPDVAAAIRRAADAMEAGDVILLEQQSIQGPHFDALTGRGLVPIEFEPDIFNAIKAATARGIIVVESAGNGFENLDDAAYDGKFDRARRDSGVIMVGAGLPEGGVYGPGPDRTRTAESNYGSVVDVQGWGRYITTTGYGDLRRELGENNWYTIDFGATSGAAAMVAGAAAVLESIVKERGQPPLSPSALRQLLKATGTPQAGDVSKRIGPRPNLRAAIAALDGQAAGPVPAISAVRMKGESGRLIVDGEHFAVGDSIIEINGQTAGKLKYPAGFILPSGEITRLMSKTDVTAMLPRGVDVTITVYTRSTGARSEPFTFRRE
ncbi:MAG TPA: S8 family serine peptidase [Blastocatellia bacterium]|nr:S8 family serine peptidase [Blastocatellia bacterium]